MLRLVETLLQENSIQLKHLALNLYLQIGLWGDVNPKYQNYRSSLRMFSVSMETS